MLIPRKRRPRYAVQAPLTSLIDIVFLLLIYFLLTTNFMVDEGIDVNPPQAEASRTQVERELTIHVDAEGRTFLDGRKVALRQLFEHLKGLLSQGENPIVVIKADRSLILNKAVQVMDVAKAAGAGRLFLVTEKRFERP